MDRRVSQELSPRQRRNRAWSFVAAAGLVLSPVLLSTGSQPAHEQVAPYTIPDIPMPTATGSPVTLAEVIPANPEQTTTTLQPEATPPPTEQPPVGYEQPLLPNDRIFLDPESPEAVAERSAAQLEAALNIRCKANNILVARGYTIDRPEGVDGIQDARWIFDPFKFTDNIYGYAHADQNTGYIDVRTITVGPGDLTVSAVGKSGEPHPNPHEETGSVAVAYEVYGGSPFPQENQRFVTVVWGGDCRRLSGVDEYVGAISYDLNDNFDGPKG